LATSNKDFRIKNGLIVDGTSATVNGNDVLTSASSIDDLSDVTITEPSAGQVIKWNGSAWINDTDAIGEGGAGNSFTTIDVPNGTDPVADSATDTLTFSDGANITITGDSSTDTVTVAVDADLTGITSILTPNYIGLDLTPTGVPGTQGTLAWNPDQETLDIQLDTNVVLPVGQKHVIRVKNSSGSVAIPKGRVVMFAGAVGDTVTVTPAISTATYEPYLLVGVTSEEIPADGVGFVTQYGFIRGINTNSFTLGDLLYVDPESPGVLTNSAPAAPNWTFPIAAVTRVNASSGIILVRTIPGGHLHDVVDVAIEDLSDGQTLSYNDAAGVWSNIDFPDAKFYVSSTAPSSPVEGDVWFNSVTMQHFVYYDGYWVESNSAVGGPEGPQGPQGPQGIQGEEGPQGPVGLGTVAVTAPITNTGTSTDAVIGIDTSGLLPVENPTYTGAATGNRIRLTDTTDASLSSTGHAFQVGLSNTENIAVSKNAIMSRNNGAVNTLLINEPGGNILLGNSDSTVTIPGTLAGVTKAMVGLGNVDNTSDANKPVSSATQTALNLKANLASPTFTGTPTAPLIRLTNTTNATTSSTGHAFQVGADNATNLRIDNNEVTALNNGAVSTLLLNPLGGDVSIGTSASTTTLGGRLDATHYPFAMSTGTVTITPAANAITGAAVVFPSGRFTVAPFVYTDANSAATAVTNTSHSGVSTSGATIYVLRTNTTSTIVRWMAVQMTSAAANG
jgi:hypothetical protein